MGIGFYRYAHSLSRLSTEDTLSRTKRGNSGIKTGKNSYKRILQKEANRKVRHMKITEESDSQEIKVPKSVRFNYW